MNRPAATLDRLDVEAMNEGRLLHRLNQLRPKVVGRGLKVSRKCVNGHVQYRLPVEVRL